MFAPDLHTVNLSSIFYFLKIKQISLVDEKTRLPFIISFFLEVRSIAQPFAESS
jgi:hypothetical protein